MMVPDGGSGQRRRSRSDRLLAARRRARRQGARVPGRAQRAERPHPRARRRAPPQAPRRRLRLHVVAQPRPPRDVARRLLVPSDRALAGGHADADVRNDCDGDAARARDLLRPAAATAERKRDARRGPVPGRARRRHAHGAGRLQPERASRREAVARILLPLRQRAADLSVALGVRRLARARRERRARRALHGRPRADRAGPARFLPQRRSHGLRRGGVLPAAPVRDVGAAPHDLDEPRRARARRRDRAAGDPRVPRRQPASPRTRRSPTSSARRSTRSRARRS